MFISLIKIIILFFFIYFIYNLLRVVLRLNWSMKNKEKDNNDREKTDGGRKENGRVIELDKDQYKVE